MNNMGIDVGKKICRAPTKMNMEVSWMSFPSVTILLKSEASAGRSRGIGPVNLRIVTG
jgi:hypothetical protein